jgi:hypothetical protein
MYNRARISAIFLEGMRRLGIEVIAGVSDLTSLKLCIEQKIDHIYYQNRPVGAKFNRTLQEALLKKDWTHLMISGDDDLYDSDILGIYSQHQHEPCIGFGELYFLNPLIKKACKFVYDPTNTKTIGAGRLIRREVIETLLSTGAMLWDPERNSALDASMELALGTINIIPKRLTTSKTLIYDIKSHQNIWRYNKLAHFKGKNLTPMLYQKVMTLIPEKERMMIHYLNYRPHVSRDIRIA